MKGGSLCGTLEADNILSIIRDPIKSESMKKSCKAVGIRDASDKLSVLSDELLEGVE